MSSHSASPPPQLGGSGHQPSERLAAVDCALRLVEVSAPLATLLGQPAALLRDRPLAEALPDWGPTLDAAARQVLGTRSPVMGLPLPPGPAGPGAAQGWVASLSPVLTRGGAILGVEIAVHPPGAAPQPALPIPWPEILTVLEHMPVGLLMLEGPTLRVRWANPAYRGFLDEPFQADPLVGRQLEEFVPRAEESGVTAIFRAVAATGAPYVAPEYRHEGFARGVTFFRWSLMPLPRADAAFDLLLVAAEITEQVALRRDAEALAAALLQERAQLAAILEQLPVGLYLAEAPSGRILRHNAEAARLLGHELLPAEDPNDYAQYGAMDLRGRALRPEMHPMARAVRGEVVQAEQLRYRRGDGRVIQLEVSAAPVHDEAGAIAFAVATFHDVSERELLHVQLAQQAQLLDQAHEAMLGWELAGPIVFWNRGAEELYGFSRAEVLGQVSHDVLRTGHARPMDRIEAELTQTGQWQGELQHTTKDGRTILVESRQTLVVGPDGRRVVLEANRDITARRRAEEHLRHLQMVTASFAAAQTLAQVHQVILDELRAALGATRVFVRVVTPEALVAEGEVLGLPIAVEVYRHASVLSFQETHPAVEAAQSGGPVFLRDAPESALRYPDWAERTRRSAVEASAHLPLMRGDEVYGVLTVSFDAPRAWDADERAFAATLADRAAVAYERARLFEAERGARERAERLQAVTTALNSAITPAQVYAAILRYGLGPLGAAGQAQGLVAQAGTLYLLRDDSLERTAWEGFDRLLVQQYQRIPLDASTPATETARGGAPIWLHSQADFIRRYPHLEPHIRLMRGEAVASLPLQVEGRRLGVLTLTFPQPLAFSAAEQGFLLALADQAAQALERSRLFVSLHESEERFRSLFESIDEGFCIIELLFDERHEPADYRFLQANPAFEQLTGLHDAVGRTARELVPGLEAFWFETYGRVALTGEVVRFESESAALGRWFDVYASRVGDAASRRVVVVFKNITERKRAEEALRKNEALLNAVLEAMPVGVIIADAGGKIVRMNAAAETIWGVPPETTSWEQYGAWVGYWPATGERVKADEWTLARTLRTGKVITSELIECVQFGTGRRGFYMHNAAPVRDASGAIIAGVVAELDVTESRRLYEQEQRARAAAEQAVRLREQFLSIASHELRTPLTSVMAHAQTFQRRALREGSLGERDRRSLQQILAHAERLNRMIGAMLDVGRIDQGRLRLERVPLDLAALVREVVAGLDGTSPRHRMVVTGAAAGLRVLGDALRLEQVLQNLLGNAVKYSPDGGPITVALAADAATVQVTVHDEGIGIPAQDVPHIFQRFYRAGNVSADTITGVGIGLFVVQEIVALHGGAIAVASEEGVGSSFTVTLPRLASP